MSLKVYYTRAIMTDISEPQADIALIGLAVMGQNLILNMNDHGFKVVAYNRTVSKVDTFLQNEAKGTEVIGAHSVEEMVAALKKPRRIMMMVKAGEAVDETIKHILPHLDEGDILIDGGNTLFTDTIRREADLRKKGIFYIGTGVSGGEEGARHGPSIMPGGSPEAWPHVAPILQAIAAKGTDGKPCCDWVGDGGAGHYVKMVHNGIEYGDMQLISETYQILKDYVKLDNDQMADVFDGWNKGFLDSYLIEITAKVLRYKDEDGQPLLDKIVDSAGQKGTGRWTAESSAELGQPTSVITEALYARYVSSFKKEREEASKVLAGPEKGQHLDNKDSFLDDLSHALYASKIISYTQGFMLMTAAAKEYGWDLHYGNIAQMWTGGCIIRSRFLSDIKSAYANTPDLNNLLLDPFFTKAISEGHDAWRNVISEGVKTGIPMPAFSSALSFYDAYRTKQLPANLIQAQRDYFGAHTYERIDKPAGEFFHTNWTGTGGTVSAGSYSA
jgi:6-phosphogluconate dehydrogenase